MSKPPQSPRFDNVMRSKSKVVQNGMMGQRIVTATVNPATLSGSQRGSSLGGPVITAARSDTVYDCTSSQQDVGQLAGNTTVPECVTRSQDENSQASTSDPPPL
ncbi:hypothetical protein BDR03DRAFT_958208 [Suillus americanus]|nr:hypothetical protein BDR03DRAFT_958208 [Suillus americanus]